MVKKCKLKKRRLNSIMINKEDIRKARQANLTEYLKSKGYTLYCHS